MPVKPKKVKKDKSSKTKKVKKVKKEKKTKPAPVPDNEVTDEDSLMDEKWTADSDASAERSGHESDDATRLGSSWAENGHMDTSSDEEDNTSSGYVPGSISAMLSGGPIENAFINVPVDDEVIEREDDDGDEELPVEDKADENTMSSNEEDNTVEQEEPKEEKDSKTKTKKEKKKKKKRKKELGPLETQPQRTIFVGNVHNDVQINKLKKFFQDAAGPIESIRYRSITPGEENISKKVAAVTENFHHKLHNHNAYIVFKEVESVKPALKLNGVELSGNHLRVDTITEDSHKRKKTFSIFVGNLPFDVQEDTLRKHFSDCGTVLNVRVVRDNGTRMGKGFGFIEFKEKSAVTKSLDLNDSLVKTRKVRVKRCLDKESQLRLRVKEKRRSKIIEKDAKRRGVDGRGQKIGSKFGDSKFTGKKSVKKTFIAPTNVKGAARSKLLRDMKKKCQQATQRKWKK